MTSQHRPLGIEALIERVKRSGIEPRDAQLVERLLRLVLSMDSLLEHKNASIKRLKRLIFGPGSDARTNAGASAKEPASDIAADPDADLSPDANSGSAKSCTLTQKPKRPGHGRKRCGESSKSRPFTAETRGFLSFWPSDAARPNPATSN